MRPGYHRVASTTESGSVLTSAYVGPRRLVVVATNTGGGSETLALQVSGGRLRGKVTAVRTDSGGGWQRLKPKASKRTGFRATLPPQSVTTFVVAR